MLDYNQTIVLIGTTLLGAAGGMIGSFLLLRKRSLLADALSHATLPGVAAAFLIAAAVSGAATARSLPPLLAGAAVSGTIGVLCVMALTRYTRIKDDAALAIVLSVFFGLGGVLMGVVQQLPGAAAAGLQSFIFGKTASMIAADAQLIAVGAGLTFLVCLTCFKEFRLLCFDPDFARGNGYSVDLLDLLLMAMVTLVTVVGLQAVGLVLIIAVLVIPPTTARLWTHRLAPMTAIASILGAAASLAGVWASTLYTQLPSGASIVLAAAVFFFVSLLIAPAGGALHRVMQHLRTRRAIGRQHLLRCAYEVCESRSGIADSVFTFDDLFSQRGWSRGELRRELGRGRRDGVLDQIGPGRFRFTRRGVADAERVTRNHRLWELYLLTHTEVARDHVDRAADDVEHALGPRLTRELEALLTAETRLPVPASPHGTVKEALP